MFYTIIIINYPYLICTEKQIFDQHTSCRQYDLNISSIPLHVKKLQGLRKQVLDKKLSTTFVFDRGRLKF